MSPQLSLAALASALSLAALCLQAPAMVAAPVANGGTPAAAMLAVEAPALDLLPRR